MSPTRFQIVRAWADPFLPAFVFGVASTEGGRRGSPGADAGSVAFGDMPMVDGAAADVDEEAQASSQIDAGQDRLSIMTSPVIDLTAPTSPKAVPATSA